MMIRVVLIWESCGNYAGTIVSTMQGIIIAAVLLNTNQQLRVFNEG